MSILNAGRPSRKERAIASVQERKEETIRMNVNISKVFYKEIKQRALDEETNVTEIVKQALQCYMSK